MAYATTGTDTASVEGDLVIIHERNETGSETSRDHQPDHYRAAPRARAADDSATRECCNLAREAGVYQSVHA